MPSAKGKSKNIIVVGGGLGGMAAAITCAANGCKVTLFEKNQGVGGKCNILYNNGFTVDLGPSILILPEIFRLLFRIAGREFDNYIKINPIECQWRNFFEDGTIIDLYNDFEHTCAHIESLYPGSSSAYSSFNSYAVKQFDFAESMFLAPGSDTLRQLILNSKFFDLRHLDIFRTMHAAVASHFNQPNLREIFDHFIKYVGSSAYRAPAFMNLLYGAQKKRGLWYVEGGIYQLALAMKSLLQELGVTIHLGTEVIRICTNGKFANGVITSPGEYTQADAVISNMEVIPAYRKLLPFPPDFPAMIRRFEPACSGIIVHLGLDCTYSQLAHHNFFYSRNQKHYFKEIFENYRLPEDPTIYVVAPTRTDPLKAPKGKDLLKILPHIPYLRHDRPYSRADYENFMESVLDKLDRMGLRNIRDHIVFRDVWTPLEIETRYYSNAGSIYGVVTDMWKNFGFKAPKRSNWYKNLFFTGGSVNPGAGMPMVVLSGIHAGWLACG